jgi:1,4-dihydroxy-2-naphthoate polyprenyltransferase
MASEAIRPGSFRAWLLATRPATLSAALVPVAVGSACAHAAGSFRARPALACLAGAMLLQIAANFANDLFDYEKGADTAERLGPTRAVQAGLLTPRAVKRGLALTLGLALLVGVYLTAIAGWPVVVIGLASIAAALAYTAGPYPLGYHGLGDVFVMLFFGGVAVAGTVYVQALDIPSSTWPAAIAVGALATAILVVNNLRDRETDARAGKRTLAVRWGKQGAIAEYTLLLVMAYAAPVLLVVSGGLAVTALLPGVTLPRALYLLVQVRKREGKELNLVLVSTAQLLLTFGLMLAAGIAVGARI